MQVRETTVNDPEVVRCLRDNFVPFAADSYKIYRGAKNLGLVARGWNIRQVTSSFHVFAPDGTRIGMTPSAYTHDGPGQGWR